MKRMSEWPVGALSGWRGAGGQLTRRLHRLQFAFTLIYHYLFPQLTMGLALPTSS